LRSNAIKAFGASEMQQQILEEARRKPSSFEARGILSIARRISRAARRRCSSLGAERLRRAEVLDALVDHAPPPGSRAAIGTDAERVVQPTEPAFTGVVFKIQANMDPGHRDRIAFVRVCSGRFERGMRLVNCRSGREVKTASVVSFLSQRRDIVDEAYAATSSAFRTAARFASATRSPTGGTAVPRPAILRAGGVRPHRARHDDEDEAAARRAPAARREGAIQIFHPHDGGAPILGAVGPLQFEVVVHRLAHEYGAEVRLLPANYYAARWISGDPAELERFIAAYPHLIVKDAAGVLAFLAPSKAELEVRQERFDKIASTRCASTPAWRKKRRLSGPPRSGRGGLAPLLAE